ncbi:predicted protein [Sclerotinia sclerotiorum 1980 UF-70]|uniref:Uncharacterized protein n=2 Tax=Sclerotinia sclerotiorum (strain ATCC 18683 / 1980 / Ss-1) TaxID=665079 RepID=A7EQH3_SCLS1|nr:predicted protein [Sclerotinia sclerotiorum 1980 UF-70]APA13732.1 hypothetical protein sscle_11g085020 [Sclerotinia sclerotiorum 1980 UF-70]EDN91715.1 predicted protein [Sclerotinia sclerotiorum 1980 UF-70]
MVLIVTVFLIGLLLGILIGNSAWAALLVGSKIQTSILRELLETSADKRSDRILDLCFFQLAKTTWSEDVDHFLTDEVINHLEAKIHNPAPIPNPRVFSFIHYGLLGKCKLDYSIPSIVHPMGYDEEVIKVMQRIQEHRKKRANQHMEVATCGERSGNTSNYDDELWARKDAKKLGDVEKGLGSLPSS